MTTMIGHTAPEIPLEFINGKSEGRIIPRSMSLFLAMTYIGLFIIRPWEQLLPQLSVIHFERLFGIFMLLGVAVTSGFRFRLNIQNAAVVAFLAATGLSAAFAYDPAGAWDEFYKVLTLIMCYFVIVSVVKNAYHLAIILCAYIWFMELYLCKALWEYFIYGRHDWAMGVIRLIGIEVTYGAPNALANSIVLSLPFWLLLWRTRHEIAAGWPGVWRRLFTAGLAIYAGLAAVSIPLTNSRTGMINLCVFLFLASLRRVSLLRLVRNILILMLLLAAGWFLLPEQSQNRARTVWDPSAGPESAQDSVEGRYDAFRAALVIFRRFPILGVGVGSFIPYRVEHVDGIRLDPHNLIGQTLAETGIVGMMGFLFLVVAPFVNNIKLQRIVQETSGATPRFLGQTGRACRDVIILLFIEGMAGHNLHRYNWLWLGAFCMLALSFAAVFHKNHTADEWPQETYILSR